jgi:hypothetical protein
VGKTFFNGYVQVLKDLPLAIIHKCPLIIYSRNGRFFNILEKQCIFPSPSTELKNKGVYSTYTYSKKKIAQDKKGLLMKEQKKKKGKPLIGH